MYKYILHEYVTEYVSDDILMFVGLNPDNIGQLVFVYVFFAFVGDVCTDEVTTLSTQKSRRCTTDLHNESASLKSTQITPHITVVIDPSFSTTYTSFRYNNKNKIIYVLVGYNRNIITHVLTVCSRDFITHVLTSRDFIIRVLTGCDNDFLIHILTGCARDFITHYFGIYL